MKKELFKTYIKKYAPLARFLLVFALVIPANAGFNFTDIPINESNIITVSNPNDIVIDVCLIIIAFNSGMQMANKLYYWLVGGDDDY